MMPQRTHARTFSKQSDNFVHEAFNGVTKRESPLIREDRKLRVGCARSWIPFASCRSRATRQQWKRARLLFFLVPFVAFVGTALCFKVLYMESGKDDISNVPPIHISPEPKLNIQLRRPPVISKLLPRLHNDGRTRKAPEKHLAPFVYTAVGIATGKRDSDKTSLEILLFLYTQGTIACTGEHATPCSHLDVTSCMVGADLYPVIYDANGVFTCLVRRALRSGEPLTVVVSKDIWKQKLDTPEDSIVEDHLKSMKVSDDESFIVSSDTVWEDQIDPHVEPEDGRYRVCLMTQEKVFPEYVPEWLAYHRRIGIDFVYIYDNNSPKSIARMYKNANDVEVIHWPWERSQYQAQNHFLLVGRRRCQWGILIDVDEFIMMRPGHYEGRPELPLKAMLRDMRETRDVSQIRLKTLVLGSSGHIYHPRGPIAESYYHLARRQDNLTKPIVWLGHVMPDSIVHRVETSPGYYTGLSADYLNMEGDILSIGLCHLKYRSWEDYVEKGRGGRNSFQVSIWGASSNWSIHSPPINHLSIKNKAMFTDFRRIWRRTIGRRILEPELRSWLEADWRYDRIKRKGWVWKRRRALVAAENTTLSTALIERERAFQKLKDWEIAKRDHLARWNKPVDFLT